MGVSVGTFNQEAKCNYKDEDCSVRDNGAVLRHTPTNKRTIRLLA